MIITSKINEEKYDEYDIIKIPNHLQAYKYMINGLQPVDLVYTDRLVFVFNRNDSKNFFDKWCRHEL